MDVPRAVNRSITLRKTTIEFINQWLKEHATDRLKDGKALTTVSIIREALLLWAEQHGILEELLKALESHK